MNDEFLTQFREAPRAKFAEALYERISQQSQPRFVMPRLNRLTLRNVVSMLAFMLIVAACAYYAATQTPYRKVGGIWLTVQKTRIAEYVPTPEVIVNSDVPFQTEGCPSLEKAREILRFDFHIPTWAPEGFTFNGTVCGVDPISDFASLSWKHNDGTSFIGLLVRNLKWRDPYTNTYKIEPAVVWDPVAPGSYKEVQVNDQPAVLIRGDWASPIMFTEPLPEGKTEVEWDKDLGLRLYWVQGEALYELYTHMPLLERHHLTIADVSPEDLIKMAESAR